MIQIFWTFIYHILFTGKLYRIIENSCRHCMILKGRLLLAAEVPYYLTLLLETWALSCIIITKYRLPSIKQVIITLASEDLPILTYCFGRNSQLLAWHSYKNYWAPFLPRITPLDLIWHRSRSVFLTLFVSRISLWLRSACGSEKIT